MLQSWLLPEAPSRRKENTIDPVLTLWGGGSHLDHHALYVVQI